LLGCSNSVEHLLLIAAVASVSEWVSRVILPALRRSRHQHHVKVSGQNLQRRLARKESIIRARKKRMDGKDGSDQMDGGGQTPRTTAVQFENRAMEQKRATGEPPTDIGKDPRQRPHERLENEEASDSPAAKRFKPIPAPEAPSKQDSDVKGARTPSIVTEPNKAVDVAALMTPRPTGDVGEQQQSDSQDRKLPAAVGDRDIGTSGSISPSSDISSGSSTHRKEANSPVPSGYAQEVPPAPPSTPASNTSALAAFDVGLATPLPFQEGVRNARQLEQQQLLSEGGVTPAPNKPDSSGGGRVLSLSEDFSEWAVGDRYEMIRILGRGSYGEVAQAVDKYAGRADAYVAIKRILSPFDQEIDAVRLYREIHILRRLRGHRCIINLLDIVQPPTDDLDDFHDLYLVFECKFA
jgi:Protein kinase domain